MVNLSARYMRKRGLKFSTNIDISKSKTKCIVFSQKEKDRSGVLPITLNGDKLPWVKEVKHLGNMLESDNSMRRDMSIKRSKLIGKINSLSQKLHFVRPDIFMKILNIYCVSFHGSCLWNLYSNSCDKLFKTWNVAVRQAWSVPYNKHRYLIEEISESLHLKVMLSSRLVGFRDSLLSSPKYCIRVLGNLRVGDKGTLIGQSLRKISTECKSDSLTPMKVKKLMKYYRIPEMEKWRLGPLKEILSSDMAIPGFSQKELEDILQYLATT